jgi:hypothetical protein
MMKLIAAAFAALLSMAGATQAATVTITFDELADDTPPDPGAGEGQVANVRYVDENCRNFGNCLPFIGLSDDGYYDSTSFTAVAGTTFTPISVDLTGQTNLVRASTEGLDEEAIADLESDCSDDGACEGATPFGFDNISITGYRDGAAIAQDFVGGPDSSFNGLYTFSSAFADIDALTIEILGRPASGLPPGYAYGCGSLFYAGCVSGSVDDFTFETAAVVPLPAALPSLVLALGGLALLRRRG